MCGRVSAQMRKLNQPIGAIQRNTKLMEPADYQTLKPIFSYLQADMEMETATLLERSVQSSLWGICRRKRAGRGNGDDLASMAGRRSICWTVCFPRLPCSTASAASPPTPLTPAWPWTPKVTQHFWHGHIVLNTWFPLLLCYGVILC